MLFFFENANYVPKLRCYKDELGNTSVSKHSCQNDFKGCYMKQRRKLHNDQGIIQEDDIAIVNINAPNIGAPQYKAKDNNYKRRNQQ